MCKWYEIGWSMSWSDVVPQKSSSFALSFARFHHSLGTPLCPLPISSALFPIHKSASMKNHRPKPWNQLWKSMKICTDDNFKIELLKVPAEYLLQNRSPHLDPPPQEENQILPYYKNCPKFPFSRCLCQHYAGSKPSSHADPFSLFVCWRFFSTLEHGFLSKLLCSDWFSHCTFSLEISPFRVFDLEELRISRFRVTDLREMQISPFLD